MEEQIKSFYDDMATQYDMLFQDWNESSKKHANILDKIFNSYGYHKNISILDCACGIGTQAIGLSKLGYNVTASDLSENELKEAQKRSETNEVSITFKQANFCKLSDYFSTQFDIIIAMDNALPHMLTKESLHCAIESIYKQTKEGGIFVASIRDYDKLLDEKPSSSTPYIYKTEKGQKVSFQTWEWLGDNYKFIQYIIDDEDSLKISKFNCEYRAVKRQEMKDHLIECGFKKVEFLFPQETGFYQPIFVAKK